MKKYPLLGRLLKNKDDVGSFTTNIKYSDSETKISKIKMHISCDGDDVHDVLTLAEKVVASLSALEKKSKNIISRDLLKVYNNDWREGAEVQVDGTTKPFKNPILSAKAFKSFFVLGSILVIGDRIVEIGFKPNDLFWGHVVFVQSLEGTDFSKAKAEYYG